MGKQLQATKRPSRLEPLSLDRLVRICRKHVLPSESCAVVPEPYVPYVPPKWNGVLVTAEAQNLSSTNAAYISWLNAQGATGRIRRLYDYPQIGVAPWTDGTIQIALEAALGVVPEQVAVSNAVPWSILGDKKRNANPSDQMIERARSFWSEMLSSLQPKILVVCGKVGSLVFSDAVRSSSPETKSYQLCNSSSTLLSRISNLFDADDLLNRYPEVAQVVARRDELTKSYRRNKIFFACHAFSIIRMHGPLAPVNKQ